MSVISKVEKIALLHTCIKSKVNYSLKDLCEKLNVSQSCLYNYFEELRLYGDEIEYNKYNHSYYYKNNFEFKLSILSDEQKLIIGGNKSQFHYFGITSNKLAFNFNF